MDGLVAAAKKEGTLNVIALPDNWANYGEIKKAFAAKYGIAVNSDQPDISSAQEIQAAETNKGTDKAPDVFDLGPSVAIASLSYFAPYKVSNFDQIPAGNKSADGKWVDDYTGVMAVGYNSTKFGTVTSLADLKDAKFKGAVALNGNPTQAGAGFNGVVMASLANGGSADNIAPGVDYFATLKAAGTFLPVDPTPATVESGTTGVVFDWSYNQLGYTTALKAEGVDWKTYVPDNAAVGSYYVQAINVDAPHPAAARLWQEYLYSDAAQNMFMKGGAKPVLYDVMKAAGTIDAASAANLPTFAGTLTQLTADQTATANAYLKANWSKVSG
jgi:putative spermidine/putrescine transport system substrate-binding protein